MKSTHRKLWRSLQKTLRWYAPSFKNFEKAWLTKMCNYKAHVKKKIWNFPLMPCNNAPMGNSISSLTHPLLHPKSFNFSDVTCDLTPPPPPSLRILSELSFTWTCHLQTKKTEWSKRLFYGVHTSTKEWSCAVCLRGVALGCERKLHQSSEGRIYWKGFLKGFFWGLEGFLFIQAWCM